MGRKTKIMAHAKSPLAPKHFSNLPEIHGVKLQVAHTGLRYKNRDDLLLMSFADNFIAMGVFTKSLTRSAPVDWCKNNLKNSSKAHACLVNAGNANAFTGHAGQELVEESTKAVADLLKCKPNQVYCASTGVIGVKLPADSLAKQLPKLRNATWDEAAQAIMTTDTYRKIATAEFQFAGKTHHINAIAKGSGMIAPNMATMLVFMATDAPLIAEKAQRILELSVNKSFNSITVDGDTSTSDTLLLFAPKAKQDAEIDFHDWLNFHKALDEICLDLAIQVVKDGEGAQKFIEIHVYGAQNDDSARKIGLAIGNSPLVKTAIAGEDANWGRVVMAVGKAGEPANRDTLSIKFGGVLVATNGEAVPDYDEKPVAKHLKTRHIIIEVDLAIGEGKSVVYTCDLTHQYIDINADYRS